MKPTCLATQPIPARYRVPVIAFTFVLLTGCEQNAFVPPPPPKVEVAAPVQKPVTRYLDATGNTAAIKNVDLVAAAPDAKVKSIPGHPRWALAPLEMAWEGKSNGEICAQLKDPKRNGGKSLATLHEHFARDDLVAWGWNPGEGREPAPGSQELAGQLLQAWIDSGAVCP